MQKLDKIFDSMSGGRGLWGKYFRTYCHTNIFSYFKNFLGKCPILSNISAVKGLRNKISKFFFCLNHPHEVKKVKYGEKKFKIFFNNPLTVETTFMSFSLYIIT